MKIRLWIKPFAVVVLTAVSACSYKDSEVDPTCSVAPPPAQATAAVAPAPVAAAATLERQPPPLAGNGRRPFVVIRFDHATVVYEDVLLDAVNRALERRPQAKFDLVAVAPVSGNAAAVAGAADAAKDHAAAVLKSLTGMGLPADRVSLSAMVSADVKDSEVRLYLR